MSLWLAVGGAVVDGVLTETPGLARVPVDAAIEGDVATFPSGVTLGPFPAAGGPFGAFGLFDAVTGGTMSFSAAMPTLSVVPGQYLSFPAGSYAMTPAPGPGGDVLTIGGVPVTLDGQPLQVG